MSGFKFNVSAATEDIRDGGSSSSILRNGVHPVTLKFASVVETKHKAYQLNLNVVSGGKDFVLYGPIIQNKDGNPNTIGMRLLHKLSIVAGLAQGQQVSTSAETHPVGKDQVMTELQVIPEFSDLDCQIHIQEEYNLYDNRIQENFRIRNVFNAEGASADEIVRGDSEDFGKQLAVTLEKFVDNTTYSDGLTAEAVQEWKKAQRAGSNAAAPASAAVTKRTAVFGQR